MKVMPARNETWCASLCTGERAGLDVLALVVGAQVECLAGEVDVVAEDLVLEEPSGLGVPGNRLPSCAACAHRRSDTQLPMPAKPRIVWGLTRRRTSAAVARTKPQSASAKPIAEALYRRRASISRGTTRSTAAQTTHR